MSPIPPPAVRPRCDECGRPAKVGACRMCQNRFWCGQACMERDQATHAFNCSPLEGPVTPPAFHLSQLDALVKAISAPVLQWNNYVMMARAQKMEVDTDTLKGAKGIQDCPGQLPPPLRCNERVLAATAKTFPFRAGIVNLSHLFLIHFMARRPPGLTAALTNAVARVSQIDCRHPLHVPKVLTRPADLSPGEYAALIQPMVTIASNSKDADGAEVLERWAALYTAHEELWDLEYE